MKECLEDFLEHLALNENASDHTVRAYESDLSQFLAFLAQQTGRKRAALVAEDFSQSSIRAFLGDRHKRGNARSSAARKLAALRTFARYLRREGILDADPAALVGTPKREQRLPAHLGEKEMTTLLEMPDVSQPLGRRDRAILELFYASGLRLSELVGLDLEDVNLSTRIVRVMGKGRKERLVPFNRSTEAAVRAWLKDWEGFAVGAGGWDSGLGGARGLDRSCQGETPFKKGCFSSLSQLPGRTAVDSQRGSAGEKVRGTVQHAVRDQPARAAALLRHASARARRGPPRDSGTARARASQHDAALHARELNAAAGRLPKSTPQSLT